MHASKARATRLMAGAAVLAMTGCSTLSSVTNIFSSQQNVPVGQLGNVTGFLGGVVADEPQAALAGRAVLSAGGAAADAATAIGFMLSVTLPSRAGLGAGGACLAYDPSPSGPGAGTPEAVVFQTVAPSNPGVADRPAGVPMLARGLFALQARYGKRPVETLIAPAEQFARFGGPVSRAFLRDLAVVAGPLSGDPGARSTFFANGAPLAEGATMLQPELGGTLAQLRMSGVGDLYQGLMARRLEAAMPAIGGGLSVADMRQALPRVAAAQTFDATDYDRLAVLPLPEAGGIATAAAAQILARNLGDVEQARLQALAVAGAARKGGATVDGLLGGTLPAVPLGSLPASTTFGALDQYGGAVMCAVSMGNLFGTGRVAPGTGILMGASPARLPQPLLAISILYAPNGQAFHGMSGGSGQEGAPLAAAIGLAAGLTGTLPAQPPEPGRANVIVCPGYVPGNSASCGFATDPRGLGLAAGSN